MNFNNTHSIACWLIIATLSSILFSPPLVSLAQILLVLVHAEIGVLLRNRITPGMIFSVAAFGQ